MTSCSSKKRGSNYGEEEINSRESRRSSILLHKESERELPKEARRLRKMKVYSVSRIRVSNKLIKKSAKKRGPRKKRRITTTLRQAYTPFDTAGRKTMGNLLLDRQTSENLGYLLTGTQSGGGRTGSTSQPKFRRIRYGTRRLLRP